MGGFYFSVGHLIDSFRFRRIHARASQPHVVALSALGSSSIEYVLFYAPGLFNEATGYAPYLCPNAFLTVYDLSVGLYEVMSSPT